MQPWAGAVTVVALEVGVVVVAAAAMVASGASRSLSRRKHQKTGMKKKS
jgi:hypothetical protein